MIQFLSEKKKKALGKIVYNHCPPLIYAQKNHSVCDSDILLLTRLFWQHSNNNLMQVKNSICFCSSKQAFPMETRLARL